MRGQESEGRGGEGRRGKREREEKGGGKRRGEAGICDYVTKDGEILWHTITL